MAEIETILDGNGNAYYPRTTAAAVSDTATGNLANTLSMSVRTSEEVIVEDTPEDVDVYGDIATLKDGQNATSAAVTELQSDVEELRSKIGSGGSGSTETFTNKTTSFNPDGSITEVSTLPDSTTSTKTTTFNADGSITEQTTLPDGSTSTKTTTFNPDGSITEEVS